MAISELYFTENDHRRLCGLLGQAVGTADPRLRADLGRLSLDLKSARVVQPEQIPTDVVTLNSRVVVKDMDSQEEDTWLLTLPNEASVVHQRLSVLAPLGTALLGSRVGQTVEWESPGGKGRVQVLKLLFQPEANGCYQL